MSSSKTDRDYYRKMEQLKLNQNCDADEEESWISGEELITEESTDEEDEKCKSKSGKQNVKSTKGRKGSSSEKYSNKFLPKTTTLPPIKRENASMSSSASTKSSTASADVNFNDEEASSWRPKRGSIKLSDLEGYQLVQMRENQLSDEMNSGGDRCQEDELYSNNVSALSLDFLKEIELNDLQDILKKYLNEDEISSCDYLSDGKRCSQDAREFGGIYSDLVNKDPSLNDVLVQMNNLDNVLIEKTEKADKFLNDGKSKAAVKHVKVTKCCKNIHLSNPRKMSRPLTCFTSKNIRKSSVRMIKSANINSQEIDVEDNSNQIKMTDEEMKRVEEILANHEHEKEETVKLNPGEGFRLSAEDTLTVESIDLKLRSICTGQPAPQRLLDNEMQSLDAELKKLQIYKENEMLKGIDSKLELLQRDKNKNEKCVSDDELNRLLQTLRSQSPKLDDSDVGWDLDKYSEIDSDEVQSSLKSNLETISIDPIKENMKTP